MRDKFSIIKPIIYFILAIMYYFIISTINMHFGIFILLLIIGFGLLYKFSVQLEDLCRRGYKIYKLRKENKFIKDKIIKDIIDGKYNK